jgi:hypothetical protein
MPWNVYHRGAGQKQAKLNEYYAFSSGEYAPVFNSNGLEASDTNFYVGGNNPYDANESGREFVAYLFAHDPVGEDDDGMIACGSYTGNGTDQDIDLGWEPQYVLIKSVTGGGSYEGWYIFDKMRGMDHALNGENSHLLADTSDAEAANSYGTANYNLVEPIATGFTVEGTSGPSAVGTNGGTYIYMAIRAPMMVEPKSGTEVFAIDTAGSAIGGAAPTMRSPFAVDLYMQRYNKQNAGNMSMGSRIQGGKYEMYTNSTNYEQLISEALDYSNGWGNNTGANTNWIGLLFKRAKGFMDVVAYTGNYTAGYTVNHSLGVVPEMMFFKNRDSQTNWNVYHKILGISDRLYLNTDGASVGAPVVWDASPTASSFSLGTNTHVNGTDDYVAYLFATLDGVSKVGSYTGNGSNQNIDCGFSNGARFVLIKRTDSTGYWYIWDTLRGIVAGNDPHIALNTNVAEVTSDDSIDPYSTGFTVNQVAATNINVTSATYIFLSIA